MYFLVKRISAQKLLIKWNVVKLIPSANSINIYDQLSIRKCFAQLFYTYGLGSYFLAERKFLQLKASCKIEPSKLSDWKNFLPHCSNGRPSAAVATPACKLFHTVKGLLSSGKIQFEAGFTTVVYFVTLSCLHMGFYLVYSYKFERECFSKHSYSRM